VKGAREAWFEGRADLNPEKLIFIDETGATTKMARLYGRAPRGERCRAAVPYGHWKTTTFTAGLRAGGLAAPMILDGPMDGDAFRAYVTQVLVPELESAAAARTIPDLWDALKNALDAFTPNECQNYFAAAGYDAS